MSKKSWTASIAAGFLGLTVLVGCTVQDADPEQAGRRSRNFSAEDGSLWGQILIDGSSTVAPASQAVAEEFMKVHPGVRVVVGTSGTGGGFKKFCTGETDINDASRPISDSERELCAANGIEFLELRIAIDGLSVVVHPDNDWCDCLTVEQLRTLWKPGSTVTKWNELNPDWPDERIRLFGADTDSGTFDYFTEAICGKSGASRPDYTSSANDNVLVRGVSGERYSLGYFGFAYYYENRDQLQAVGISATGDSTDCVLPVPETIENETYVPLSRPLYLYVNQAKLKKPEVVEFLKYYFAEGQDLVTEVGYIRLNSRVLAEERGELEGALHSLIQSNSNEE